MEETVGITEAEVLAMVREQLGAESVEDLFDPAEFTAADIHVRLRNDNVLVALRARPEESDGGIALARPKTVPCSRCTRKGNGNCRLCKGSMRMVNPYLEPLVEAEVLAVGPGYYTESGAFVPLDVKEGDIVLVEELAGDGYKRRHDVRIVRAGHVWEDGEFKGGEIVAVVEA